MGRALFSCFCFLFLGCGRGCANCSAPGLCTECNEGLKLLTPPNSNITKCIRSCPPFYKLDQDSSPPRCQLKAKPNNSMWFELWFEHVPTSIQRSWAIWTLVFVFGQHDQFWKLAPTFDLPSAPTPIRLLCCQLRSLRKIPFLTATSTIEREQKTKKFNRLYVFNQERIIGSLNYEMDMEMIANKGCDKLCTTIQNLKQT